MHGTFASSPYVSQALVALAALLAAVVTAALGEKRLVGRVSASTVTWALPALASLAFVAVWCANGLYEGDAAGVTAAVAATALAGAATLPRNVATKLAAVWRDDSLGDAPQVLHALLVVALLAACAVIGRLAIEVPWNPAVAEMYVGYAAIEVAIVALALLALFFLTGRRGVGVAMGMGLALLVGLAEYFVLKFKNASITPADLLALGTAAEVSGAYTYSVDACVLAAVAWANWGVACAAYVLPFDAADRRAPIPLRRPVTSAAGAMLSLVALVAFVTIPRYGADFGVYLNHWQTLESASKQGFLPCFVKELQAQRIVVPEGYSDDSSAQAEAALVAQYEHDARANDSRAAAEAQFDEVRPSVIVIMNESFYDASEVAAIAAAGYGPGFVESGIPDALAQGSCYVSIFGGGTCNTEFEVLTGVNLHYVGAYKYPYTQFDFDGVQCMSQQFRDLGYGTLAMHPNLGTNWNRSAVYRQMGFDRFLTTNDFVGASRYHDEVSDAATYDRILDELAASDDPMFVLDITMQNHSPYTTGSIPRTDRLNIHPQGTDGISDSQLNEFLACVNESDRAIEEFVAKLRDLDRPVVVVFFGDHQPNCMESYVDASNPTASDIELAQAMYHTQYFIWANYDVAGQEQDGARSDEASSALGTLAMDMIGAPLTDFQKASLASRDAMPALDLMGYQSADGTWYPFDDEGTPWGDAPDATNDTEHLMALVTYREFGEVVN